LGSVDPHDFGALEAEAGHQTLLIEDEGVDAAMKGVGREAAGHSFVYDDDARAGADLPAARVVYPVHGVLVHQEKGVTVLLNTSLQAIGSGYGSVSPAGLTTHKKYSLTSLGANDESGFYYIWKDKNGGCVGFASGSRRILADELLFLSRFMCSD
jgi:hypothetical protein